MAKDDDASTAQRIEASFMEIAVSMAEQCQPEDPRRTPKVGAVIVVNGTIVAASFRGTDEHAEKLALARVSNGGELTDATVYTTLEPCTKHVRSQIEESCTERLIQAKVKRVVIGILDPNQGVCGKGVLQLQKANIEVGLFPHKLALKIMTQNQEFMRAQQGLGMRITTPIAGTVHDDSSIVLAGDYVNAPHAPDDVVVLLGQESTSWWVQPPVEFSQARTWRVQISAPPDGSGTYKVHVARVNELAKALIAYHRTIAQAQRLQLEALHKVFDVEALEDVPDLGCGISMSSIPKGIDLEDSIDVIFGDDGTPEG